MTLNQAANVTDATRVDKDTGKPVSHREQYRRILDIMGIENVIKCVPFSIDEIKTALRYLDGENLNGLPMSNWEEAAGFKRSAYILDYGYKWNRVPCQMDANYRRARITILSVSEGVCLLKEAAILWAEHDEYKKAGDSL